MSRRKRRRKRSKREPIAAVPIAEEPRDLTEAERSRLLQRFTNMKGRGIALGFVPFGPVVEAKTPEEMVKNTEAAIVAITKNEPEK
jgi:hypothetical protein